LKPEQMAALLARPEPEFRSVTLDAVWQKPEAAAGELDAEAAGAALRAAVLRLCEEAEAAVRRGAHLLVISDEKADHHTLPIPGLLATGAVHHHLIRRGLRMAASLICASGEPREVHHFAALVGYGANAVYPDRKSTR